MASVTSSISEIAAKQKGDNPTTTEAPSMGKNDFMKLLMAQLSQQDPLNPMDNTEFVAQLTQFTNLEQMQSVNSNLETLIAAQGSAQQTAATSLLGKDVLFRTSAVTLNSMQGVNTSAVLSGPASVAVSVVDSAGKVVRTMDLGQRQAGALTFSWDGKDDRGNSVPFGNYSMKYTAKNDAGDNVLVESRARQRVTGISFANGSPQLLTPGGNVNLSDIIEVNSTTPQI
jgi:flagellar basal-body rod modification protein FlgD